MLNNKSVVNKFRIAFDDLERTKIFSNRNVVKIDKIATKPRNPLYIPEASGPYNLAKANPPINMMTWAIVLPANRDRTPLAFFVLNFSNLVFNG